MESAPPLPPQGKDSGAPEKRKGCSVERSLEWCVWNPPPARKGLGAPEKKKGCSGPLKGADGTPPPPAMDGLGAPEKGKDAAAPERGG
jgi:hypothetical protein